MRKCRSVNAVMLMRFYTSGAYPSLPVWLLPACLRIPLPPHKACLALVGPHTSRSGNYKCTHIHIHKHASIYVQTRTWAPRTHTWTRPTPSPTRASGGKEKALCSH